ncbi:uncharacterized protein MONBRDRAFT_12961, partial [Monosiga brevicollis MX1]
GDRPLNAPATGFSTVRPLPTSVKSARAVWAADLDADGYPDVLSATSNGDGVGWFQNLRNGSFARQRPLDPLASVAGPRSIRVADLDRDGHPDCLAAGVLNHEVAWFRNLDGLGNFSSQQTLTTALQAPHAALPADLNNDGLPDLVVAGSRSDAVAWFRNTGALEATNPNSTWSVDPLLLTNSVDEVLSITAADFDGDGRLDLASASPYDATVAWYRNADWL